MWPHHQGLGNDDALVWDSTRLLDRAQALHTTLAYYCRSRVDVAIVQTFVRRHPEALWLEGTGSSTEESAAYILMQQERACSCPATAMCRQNRSAVRRLLRMTNSLVEANARAMELPSPTEYEDDRWKDVEDRMVQLEQEIRQLRQQEASIRQFALEAVVQIQHCHDELGFLEQYALRQPVKLSMLSCAKQLRQEHHMARCSVLEHQLDSARVELASLERLQERVVMRIKTTRQLQFGLLREALPSHRHFSCEAEGAGHAQGSGAFLWSAVLYPPLGSETDAASHMTEEYSI